MSLPRISLAEALAVAVVFCGLLAALRFASDFLTSLIGLLAALAFLGALMTALFGRGAPRASAAGFALAAALYGALFVAAGMRQESDLLGFGQSAYHDELGLVDASLPTTKLLGPLHNVLVVEQWVQTDTGETMEITHDASGTRYDPWGRVFDARSPAVPRTWRQEARSPELDNFLAVGHFGWALLFGYVGSLFARIAYARGARERSSGERGT